MDFDEFEKYCSFDYVENDGTTKVLVIFSQGFEKEYSSNFVSSNLEVANKLVASDLYNYIREQFND